MLSLYRILFEHNQFLKLLTLALLATKPDGQIQLQWLEYQNLHHKKLAYAVYENPGQPKVTF